MKAPVRGKRNNAVCANPAELPSVPHLRSKTLLAWTLQHSPQHRKLSQGVLKVVCQFLDYRHCLTQIFRRSITAYYIPTMERALLSDINPRVPSSTQLMASVCIGENLIFACGGYTHQSKRHAALNSAYLWSVDDLKRLRPMLYPRVNHQLVFYERFRSVYVFGGVDSRELIRCERFHLPSAEWHFLPPMHRQRKDLVLSRHLTSVYICGSDSALEMFDLLSETHSSSSCTTTRS